MNTITWWFLLFFMSVILELSSPGLFFFLSFSCGAVAAMLVATTTLGPIVEFCTFAVISALSFVLLTRFVKRISKDTLHKTNVYALLGKRGIVMEPLADSKKGWIKVEGELWSALPHEGSIEKGAVVEVVSAQGSHLVVKKVENHHC